MPTPLVRHYLLPFDRHAAWTAGVTFNLAPRCLRIAGRARWTTTDA
ncbi:hypothetical protein LP415_07030 [Polaromonas sp. P1(28)-8]|nr:hypothetical protein LP415_07030 [Polaromonas sp. P1(28)-8]